MLNNHMTFDTIEKFVQESKKDSDLYVGKNSISCDCSLSDFSNKYHFTKDISYRIYRDECDFSNEYCSHGMDTLCVYLYNKTIIKNEINSVNIYFNICLMEMLDNLIEDKMF